MTCGALWKSLNPIKIHSWFLPGQLVDFRLEMEQQEHELENLWENSVTGNALTCCATMLTPEPVLCDLSHGVSNEIVHL